MERSTRRLGERLESDNPLGLRESILSIDGGLSSHAKKGAILVGIFAFVMLVVGLNLKSRVFEDAYDWVKSPYRAEAESGQQGKFLIVIRHNPREKFSESFWDRVMSDSDVVARSQDYIWLKEDTNGKMKRRDNDYAALSGKGGPRTFPHIFVYSPSGRIVGGHLEGHTMTPEQFLAILDEHTKPDDDDE